LIEAPPIDSDSKGAGVAGRFAEAALNSAAVLKNHSATTIPNANLKA
jgi:hypothetical protein